MRLGKGFAQPQIFFVLAGLFIGIVIVGLLLSVGERITTEFNQTSRGAIPSQLALWGTVASFIKIVIIVAVAVLLITFLLAVLRPPS